MSRNQMEVPFGRKSIGIGARFVGQPIISPYAITISLNIVTDVKSKSTASAPVPSKKSFL